MKSNPRSRTARAIGAFLSLMAHATLATAAGAPTAGELSRDLPQPTPQVRSGNMDIRVVPADQAVAPMYEPLGSVKVMIRSVRITGVVSLPQDVVQALVTDARGRELDFAQMQLLADRITSYYRAQGYVLARAYLPPQKISDGDLLIQVSEGRLGKLHVTARGQAGEEQVTARLGRLRSGDAINNSNLEHDLLLLSDLPGVQAESTLSPGAQAGTSDLAVVVNAEPQVSPSVVLDNYGNRSTGTARATGRVTVGSAFGFGDSLDLSLSTSGKGYQYGRAAWQTPLHATGTQLGVAGSVMHYRLGKEFESLDASGRADTLSVYAIQSLQRSRTSSLQAQATLEGKRFKDTANAVTTSKRATTLSLGLAGYANHTSGGFSMGMVNLIAGKLSLDDQNLVADAAGLKTNGSYTKLAAQGEYQHPVSANLSAALRLNAQFASKNLDSSEKIGLGGPQGVRAYASSEASSDDALIGSLELRQRIGMAQAKVFVDAASGRVNHDPLATSTTNSQHRSAAGLGLDLALPASAQLQASVAWPLGSTENTETPRRPRLWVMLSKLF